VFWDSGYIARSFLTEEEKNTLGGGTMSLLFALLSGREKKRRSSTEMDKQFVSGSLFAFWQRLIWPLAEVEKEMLVVRFLQERPIKILIIIEGLL
jgi:hypothetical protein